MSVHPVLIGGQWQAASMPIGSFKASNPATKATLPDDYPISSIRDLDIALNSAGEAARVLAGGRRGPRQDDQRLGGDP